MTINNNELPDLSDSECEKIGLRGTHTEASISEIRLVEKGAKLAREWYENEFKKMFEAEPTDYQEYAVKFAAWYSGMEPEKVKAALTRFEKEESTK